MESTVVLTGYISEVYWKGGTIHLPMLIGSCYPTELRAAIEQYLSCARGVF